MIEAVVLLGATGDLARRFLYPALAALAAEGELDHSFRLLGAATRELDGGAFRALVADALSDHRPDLGIEASERLLGSVRYRATDVGDAAQLAAVIQEVGGSEGRPVAVYLALPPKMFPPAIVGLSEADLPWGSRVALEKPFGESLQDARELNDLLRRCFGRATEDIVYRVDHVLGMPTTQRFAGLRATSALIESAWDSDHIEQVSVLWEETLALEGRAAYYDGVGALKDVMENHMLQLLALITMEAADDVADVRSRKLEALRSVVPIDRRDVPNRTRRARYSAGRVPGSSEPTPAYRDEEGVDPQRATETFAEVNVDIDTERWRRTRFLLRTGKALGKRRKGIVVTFRPRSPSMTAGDELWIGIDGPDDIVWRCRGGHAIAEVTLREGPPASALPAYAHVIDDILTGTSRFAVGAAEAEEAWRIVAPVLDAWADGKVPLEEYPAGSRGP
jgi:glucose-6-phosphate 1-dehydrogenase